MPAARTNNGFTLLEMLIALALTAILAVVLFTTSNFAMLNGVWVRESVAARETGRLLPGIIDADLAGLLYAADERGRPLLPPLSQARIDNLHPPLRPDRIVPGSTEDDTVLLSFASSTSLVQEAPPATSAPVCVEYVLRHRGSGAAFVRRERAFCGVRGEFPWDELLLARQLRTVEVEALDSKEGYVTAWTAKDRQPQAIRFTFRHEDEALQDLVLLIPLPQQRIRMDGRE